MSRLYPANFQKFIFGVVVVVVTILCPLLGAHRVIFSQEVASVQTQPTELVEKLSQAISDTKWTGSFTFTGDEANPKTESYEIKQAQYQGADRWVLTARIAYGDRDVTVPIPLEIKWAGRTPVITVDNLTIPSLGTFDARVLMRRGSYAGTWSHGEKGGHLFGRYEKVNPADPPNKGIQSP